MAYLHCHSCDWSQDDFYSWHFNPISKFWDDIKWLIRPRIIELDDWIINDLEEYTGVKLYHFKEINHGQMRVLSWQWLWLELNKEWKLFREQKWWTWKSWQKDKDTAVCPNCGARDFDID